MRKTLTAIVVVLTAGSLAACKMPWDKEKEPPATPVAVSPDTPTPDPTAIAEKPADQTASTDPTKTPATPQTSPAPATK